MIPTPATSDATHQPDPQQDQTGRPIPSGIAEILALTRILIGYGLHIVAPMQLGALWRGFAIISRFLGGETLADMLFRIQRGLLRAMALENVLLRRAQRGRDLQIPTLRFREPEPRHPRAPAPSPTPGHDEPATLPTIQELESEIRRRPIGRTLAAICLDLGVSPSLCTGWFWDRMFHALLTYQGNLSGVAIELARRQTSFQDTHPPLQQTAPPRAVVREILGFFIGEPPATPPWPATPPLQPAIAGTGPP